MGERSRVRFALTLLAFVAVLIPVPTQAQGIGIRVIDESYSYTFAKEAIFEIEIESTLREANLFYTVEGEIGQSFRRAPISGGRAVATVSLVSGQIPPASQVTYFWRLEDSQGQLLRTNEQSFRYLDQQFSWKSKTREDVTVFWYGRDNLGNQLLEQTEKSLGEVKNLLGLTQSKPIRVVFYQSWADMQPAVADRWGDQQVVSLGVAMNMQTAVLFLHSSWEETLTHELTHVLTSQLMEGPYDRLPFWLSEGLATYTEGSTREGTQNPLSIGLLSSGPTRAQDIGPAYAQAQSIVTFLIQEHGGEERIRELLTTMGQGETVDNALLSVYGFDRTELEKRWRAWVGKPIAETPQPQTPPQDEPIRFALAVGAFSVLCFGASVLLLCTLKKAWRK